MERNREARRGTMAAVNGRGLSRRRQRNGNLRDSPEEDGAGEVPETLRLRDRTSKRDRERDRSSRSKRRRGDRLVHGSGGRKVMEGDDSSDESVDDEEDEEEEEENQSVSLRTSAPTTMLSPPTSSSSAQQNSHMRRNFPPARPVRLPPVWKVADEMIGVQVPRKARSASGKRSQESCVSSGGSGEQIHRQASTSPGRPSTSATHYSPSSSSASAKKLVKPIRGGLIQQWPPKATSKPQPQDKIEIDVAEVLFKMARQFECNPSKQENHKLDLKDTNGSISNEVKSQASSPVSQPSNNALSNQGKSAPKRKRPRVIKYDEDGTATLPRSTVQKTEPTEQTVKSEASSPKVAKLADSSKCAHEMLSSHTAAATTDAQNDAVVKLKNDQKLDSGGGGLTESSEVPRPDLDLRVDESDDKFKSEPPAEKPTAKLTIDLMEPPPGKSSPDTEDCADDDNKCTEPQIELAHKMGESGRDGEKLEPKRNREEMLREDRKKLEQKNKDLDLQLDLEKPSKDIFSSFKDENHKQQQQPKTSTKSESKSDKPVSPAVSMAFPMPVPGWPGNLTPFGYMGQVPPVLPLDGSSGLSKSLVPPQRLKRCATHCYIARSIRYYQQLAKMNAFWPPAAGAMQLYGAKPYNLNAVLPSESAVSNSLQGNLQGRNLSSVSEKCGSSVVSGYIAPPGGDKSSAASNSIADAERKQLLPQQISQPGSANKMLHGPALIFPLNQHPAGAAAASMRPAAPKTATGTSNTSSTTANVGTTNTGSGGSSAAVNFNFTSFPPNEAQYLAILQNGGYPFPIPAHVSPYRGASPALAMPFFSGSFYPSQMTHPSQLQQQPAGQQQSPHAQQGHHNGSSSQRLLQNSQRVSGGGPSAIGGTTQSLPLSKQHHHTAEMNQDSSINDIRVLQNQKSMYGQNFAMPIHPQKFAVISPAAATSALGGTGGNQNEKQHGPQAFAISYASVTGGAAASPGLDFISQNHPLFQSLPEAARHSYQISVAAPAAAQTAHVKKTNHHEDGKSITESKNASIAGEDERKTMTAAKGGPASGLQHSLTFSRPDSEASTISSSLMNSSSRTLNLIQAASTGGRVPNCNSNGAPTTYTSNTHLNSPGVLQQQQIVQLQKQHQLQMQHQFISHPKSSERIPTGSSATKFPQTLSGFPQALIQGGGSPSHSPQWKSSSRSAATPLPNPSTVSSSSKSQVPQQTSRVSQPNQPAPGHQTQISFGGNASKMAAGSMGGQTLPSMSSATSVVVGSLGNTATKGANIGSPQASSSVKSATAAPTSLTLPQASEKNSPSDSSLKQSSVSNRNMPSILGQPHITSTPTSSSSAKQQQLQSQPQQKQPFPQPQHFFSGAYMPPQTSQANAAAIAYYQRHQPELQSQHNNSNPTSYDPAKTMKGLPASGLLQHPGQTAVGLPHISSMQSVTVKPPDQKPAAVAIHQ